MMKGVSLPRIVVAVIAILCAAAMQPQAFARPVLAAVSGSWTEYHHDDGHTGHDATQPPVVSVTAGWASSSLDGGLYASPLVYNGIVYAATLNNTVYALNQSDGTEVWHSNLSVPETGGWTCGGFQQGILGTPIIDATGGRIYVTTLSSDDIYRVVGLNLATGVAGMTTAIPTNLTADTFDWRIQQQRGALALANGYVYVPFGGRAGDCGAYHGWIFAVPINGTAVTHVYETPGQGASFWGAGGLAVDGSGNVYAASGNGTGSGCASNLDGTPTFINDAVFRFSSTLANAGSSSDTFVPQDWKANWCNNDQDLGSAGPMLISSSLLFQSGKWGMGFLLNPANLGGMDGQLFPTPKPAMYTEAPVCLGNNNDATFGGFAYAAPFIYVECNGHGLVALSTNTSTPSFSPCDATCAAPDWHAGGNATFGPPIVAGGAVWVIDINGGGLYAFNASTGAQIFHSAGFGVNHFVTPAEAGGQVFVPAGTVIRSFNMNFNQVWSSLGGVLTSGPGESSWSSNRLDVFVRGTDNALYHKAYAGAWYGYDSLGGVLTSDADAVSWGYNRIDVFVRGTDNALYHKVWAGAWYGWESLGGVLTSGPAAASWSPNRLDVFVLGANNALYHKVWNGHWNAWEYLGGALASDPTAVSWGPNRVDVFARGTDNTLMHKWWDGAHWNGWVSLGGVLTSAPAAASCSSGHLDVYAIGAGSALFHIGFNGSTWGTWQNLGGAWASEPGAVCMAGTGVVALFERGTDNALWTSTVPAT